MQDATRRVLCFRRASCSLDLIGKGHPSLRHIKQRNLTPAVLKPLSDLEAVGGVQSVARYDFAGRHPTPSMSFHTSRTTAVCSQVQ